ncbi:hypothetical protein [Methylobacterium sp. JK268]
MSDASRPSQGSVVPFPTPELSGRWSAQPADLGDGGAAIVLFGLCLLIGGAVLLVAIQTALILRAL